MTFLYRRTKDRIKLFRKLYVDIEYDLHHFVLGLSVNYNSLYETLTFSILVFSFMFYLETSFWFELFGDMSDEDYNE